jgi:5-methylcytosine-specific restriction endonuclease McrA
LGEENLRKQHKTGEDSTNWRGGKSFEPYDARFNDLFKEGVRNRDLHACQLCGLPEEENGQALDVHHVDYNKKNTVKSNCISLCVSCHGRTHHNREYWMNYFRDNFEFIFPGENIGTEARWVS